MKQAIVLLLLLYNVAFCQIMILDCSSKKLIPTQFSQFSRFLSLPKGKEQLTISDSCYDAFKTMLDEQRLITVRYEYTNKNVNEMSKPNESQNSITNFLNTETVITPKLCIERTKQMPGFIGYYADEDKLYVEFIELTNSYHTEMGIIRDLLNQVSEKIQTTFFVYTYSSPCTFCVEEYYRLIQKYKNLVFYIGYSEIYNNNPFTNYFVEKNGDLPMIRYSKVFNKVCEVNEKEIEEIIIIQTKRDLNLILEKLNSFLDSTNEINNQIQRFENEREELEWYSENTQKTQKSELKDNDKKQNAKLKDNNKKQNSKLKDNNKKQKAKTQDNEKNDKAVIERIKIVEKQMEKQWKEYNQIKQLDLSLYKKTKVISKLPDLSNRKIAVESIKTLKKDLDQYNKSPNKQILQLQFTRLLNCLHQGYKEIIKPNVVKTRINFFQHNLPEITKQFTLSKYKLLQDEYKNNNNIYPK